VATGAEAVETAAPTLTIEVALAVALFHAEDDEALLLAVHEEEARFLSGFGWGFSPRAA
jgi:hypothetical protein